MKINPLKILSFAAAKFSDDEKVCRVCGEVRQCEVRHKNIGYSEVLYFRTERRTVMDKKMLDELVEAAGTRIKATKPGTPEHDQALGEFLDLGRLSIERDKVENTYESQTYELNLREVEEKERRRLDEKKIDNEADAKLKEILVEKLKLKITPGMIFQATTAGLVTLAVLNYEKTGVITTKAFNNWFRKTI